MSRGESALEECPGAGGRRGVVPKSTHGFNARSRVPWRRSIPRLEGGKNGVRFAAWSSAARCWICGCAGDVRSNIGGASPIVSAASLRDSSFFIFFAFLAGGSTGRGTGVSLNC